MMLYRHESIYHMHFMVYNVSILIEKHTNYMVSDE